MQACCSSGAEPLLASGSFPACARYPSLQGLESPWTLTQLCDALVAEPPQTVEALPEWLAAIGSNEHQEAARVAAEGLQGRSHEVRSELQTLSLERHLRLRAFFASCSPRTEEAELPEILAKGVLRGYTGTSLLSGLGREKRSELRGALLRSWDLLLGDGWAVLDLVLALDGANKASEDVGGLALAALRALVSGRPRVWRELACLWADTDAIPLVCRVVECLLACAEKQADKRARLPLKLFARQLAASAAAFPCADALDDKAMEGMLEAVPLAAKADEALEASLGKGGWEAGDPRDLGGALAWLCPGEWTFRSLSLPSCLQRSSVEKMESRDRVELFKVLLAFSSSYDPNVVSLLEEQADFCVELFHALASLTDQWSLRGIERHREGMSILGDVWRRLEKVTADGKLALGKLSLQDQVLLDVLLDIQGVDPHHHVVDRETWSLSVDKGVRCSAQAAAMVLAMKGRCEERCPEGFPPQGFFYRARYLWQKIGEQKMKVKVKEPLNELGVPEKPKKVPEEFSKLPPHMRKQLLAALLLLGQCRDSVGVLAAIAPEVEIEAAMDLLSPEERDNPLSYPRKALLFVSKAQQANYKWFLVITDTVLPVVDLVLDMVNLGSYVLNKRYQFLGVVGVGMLINAGISTTQMGVMEPTRYGLVSMVLNVLTFGVYCQVAEGFHCYRTGKKTDLLVNNKVCEGFESTVSLFVAVYSILISGYLDGYDELKPVQLILRWLSICSSLVTIPKCVYDDTFRTVVLGQCKGREHFATRMRKTRGKLAAYAFHASEISALLTFLIFQLATRPWGIFLLLFAKGLVLAIRSLLWLEKNKIIGTLFVVFAMTPLLCLLNVQVGGDLKHEPGIATGLVRLAALAAAWGILIWKAVEDPHADFVEQLQKPSCIGLVVISLAASVLHCGCFLQQYLAGRWSASARRSLFLSE